MTSADLRPFTPALLALAIACGGGSSRSSGPLPNVVPVSVNGAGCSAGSYLNKPCVSVKVCAPGTSTCQTIGDLLLDTGSIGLRVFSQALTVQLPGVATTGGQSAECISYLDGSSQWGPLAQADVILGGEPAVRVPIQIIDATFSSPPSSCSNADRDPASAGFNGILGVGLFPEDCGTGCKAADNGLYFACSGGACTGAAIDPSAQVQNPVAHLPLDNNGVVVRLPAVAAAGAASAQGQVVLGIGTRTNNVPPSGVKALSLDDQGEFRSTVGGSALSAFVDTGSNGYFFPPPPASGLTVCGAPNTDWFCPAQPVTVEAVNAGVSGSPSAPVSFSIANFDGMGSHVAVSPAVGGPAPAGSAVDFGLPFHLGRDIYLGFQGRSSSLGQGPVVGY